MAFQVRTLAEWEAAGVPGMLSVVIPAHNEEGHIAATVKSLVDTLRLLLCPRPGSGKVTVGVIGHLHRAVTHDRPQPLRRPAVLDKQAGGGMPQRM